MVTVSADATPGRLCRMLELGWTAHLTKPLDVPRFLEMVDQLLGTRGAVVVAAARSLPIPGT